MEDRQNRETRDPDDPGSGGGDHPQRKDMSQT